VYCTKCGGQNDDQSRFCHRCGAALGSPSQEAALYNASGDASSVPYAGFWRRLGAAIIDGILTNIVVYAVSFTIGFLFGLQIETEEQYEAALPTVYLLGLTIGIIVLVHTTSDTLPPSFGLGCVSR
jgi:hypothetical protein